MPLDQCHAGTVGVGAAYSVDMVHITECNVLSAVESGESIGVTAAIMNENDVELQCHVGVYANGTLVWEAWGSTLRLEPGETVTIEPDIVLDDGSYDIDVHIIDAWEPGNPPDYL